MATEGAHVGDASTLFSLDGKVALVTGASAGLGVRLAEVLSMNGAVVGIVGRRRDRLEEIARSLENCTPLDCDLSDPNGVSLLMARAKEELGGDLDILVNNAAYIAGGVRAEDESPEDIQRTLTVNLVSPILLAQAAHAGMKRKGGGVIINVTSMAARVGLTLFPQAVYAASKGGLEAITRQWAVQWAGDGVRVNNLVPGFFESEMTSQVIHAARVQDWILSHTIIQRHGQPSDFDGALLYLASDASRYVTGQSLVVDGGWTAC